MKDVDADYYGYRDDDDGLLAPLEREAELKGTKRLLYSS
jgi:pre-mRNA-splicing factor ISY1